MKIFNPEGYFMDGDFYYYRKDHLGNNREVWNATQNITVQKTDYYPSGMPMYSPNTLEAENNPQKLNRHRYNGKEFIEDMGYDSYDYGARIMYPAIMRFSTLDPLAEKYYSISPYAYCLNNPIRYIDPDGRDLINGDSATMAQAKQKLEEAEKIFNDKYDGNSKKKKKDFASEGEWEKYRNERKGYKKAKRDFNIAKYNYDETQARIDFFKKTDSEGFAKIDNLQIIINGKTIDVDVVVTNVLELKNPNAIGGYTYANSTDIPGTYTIFVQIENNVKPYQDILAHEFGHAFGIAKDPIGLSKINDPNIDCQNPSNWNHPQVKDAIEWQKKFNQGGN